MILRLVYFKLKRLHQLKFRNSPILNEIKMLKFHLETWSKGTIELHRLYDLIKTDKPL